MTKEAITERGDDEMVRELWRGRGFAVGLMPCGYVVCELRVGECGKNAGRKHLADRHYYGRLDYALLKVAEMAARRDAADLREFVGVMRDVAGEIRKAVVA